MKKYLFIIPLFLLSAVPVLASTEISDGSIRALYHMEDVADSSGNGYNLTNHGATFSAGLLTNSAHCASASSQYLEIPSGALPSAQSAYTIGFWYKQATAGSAEFTGLQSKYLIDYGNNVAGAVGINNGTTQLSYTYTADTSWHMVDMVDTGSSFILYWDGVSRATGTHGAFPTTSTSANICDLRLSGGGTDTPFLDGQIDEFFIATKGLSATDITSLYNSGAGSEICLTAGCGGGGVVNSTSTASQSDYFNSYVQILIDAGLVILVAWLILKFVL